MRLCDGADAVVENYRGGVMDRLGLGYETLHERFPKLVYATIRGFGDWRTGRSPYTDWPAYDVVAQAFGGVMAITGPDKDTPMKVGPGIGDLMPATMCAVGIVSAILRAHKTGRGQFVDVGMVDAILSMCERIVHQHSFTGGVPVPEGNHHPLLCPFGMFPARDGHVTIAAHADTHFPILCRLIGRPEMGTDPRLSTVQDRRAHQDEIIAAVSAFTSQRTKQELLAHLGGQVPFAPVNDVRDVFANPHFAARDMVVSVPHPGLDGDMKVAGVAIKMSETPGRVRHRAPLLGEHTDEYLTRLGLGGADIARLQGRKDRCLRRHDMTDRPRRARRVQLSTPGSSEKMMQKASELKADHVFLDLEDAVAPSQKRDARKKIVPGAEDAQLERQDALRAHQRPHHRICLRGHHRGGRGRGRASRHHHDDQGDDAGRRAVRRQAAAPAREEAEAQEPHRPGSPDRGSRGHAERRRHRQVDAAARMPGVRHGRLLGLDGRHQQERRHQRRLPGDIWHYARFRLVMACRAAGIDPVDGPFADFKNPEAYREECRAR